MEDNNKEREEQKPKRTRRTKEQIEADKQAEGLTDIQALKDQILAEAKAEAAKILASAVKDVSGSLVSKSNKADDSKLIPANLDSSVMIPTLTAQECFVYHVRHSEYDTTLRTEHVGVWQPVVYRKSTVNKGGKWEGKELVYNPKTEYLKAVYGAANVKEIHNPLLGE
jgi:hypothetical protein